MLRKIVVPLICIAVSLSARLTLAADYDPAIAQQVRLTIDTLTRPYRGIVRASKIVNWALLKSAVPTVKVADERGTLSPLPADLERETTHWFQRLRRHPRRYDFLVVKQLSPLSLEDKFAPEHYESFHAFEQTTDEYLQLNTPISFYPPYALPTDFVISPPNASATQPIDDPRIIAFPTSRHRHGYAVLANSKAESVLVPNGIPGGSPIQIPITHIDSELPPNSFALWYLDETVSNPTKMQQPSRHLKLHHLLLTPKLTD